MAIHGLLTCDVIRKPSHLYCDLVVTHDLQLWHTNNRSKLSELFPFAYLSSFAKKPMSINYWLKIIHFDLVNGQVRPQIMHNLCVLLYFVWPVIISILTYIILSYFICISHNQCQNHPWSLMVIFQMANTKSNKRVFMCLGNTVCLPDHTDRYECLKSTENGSRVRSGNTLLGWGMGWCWGLGVGVGVVLGVGGSFLRSHLILR